MLLALVVVGFGPWTPASAAGVDLTAGGGLASGTSLTSPNGRYSLSMQSDGNLVVLAPGPRVLFHTWTWGRPGARLTVQDDGNAVVYGSDGRPLWDTGTWGNRGSRLSLQDDGNLVLYRADGAALWSSGWDRTQLYGGQQLVQGQQITSANGRYHLDVQRDGNVVVYARDGRPLFATGTYGATSLRLQTDGNLVAYRADGSAAWDSGTWREGPTRLAVQDDGNVVLYRADGTAAWRTGWDSGQTAQPVMAGTYLPPAGLPVAADTGRSWQVVTVVAPSAGSTTATLTGWEIRGGRWVAVIGPVTASVGSGGVGAASETSTRTPAGTFTLTESFGRAVNPGAQLPYRQIDGNDWWVSDSASPAYNTYARCAPGGCPFREAAGENLWAQGPVYDYAAVIDYNRRPAVPGAGSAFFLHVSNGQPTAGCVATDRATVIALLRWMAPTARPLVSIAAR